MEHSHRERGVQLALCQRWHIDMRQLCSTLEPLAEKAFIVSNSVSVPASTCVVSPLYVYRSRRRLPLSEYEWKNVLT